jgi:hypothetical protein
MSSLADNYTLADHSTLLYNITVSGTVPSVPQCVGDKTCFNFTGNLNNKRLQIGTVAQYPGQNFSNRSFSISAWAQRANNVSNSESYLIVNQRYNTNCSGGYGTGNGCGGWSVYVSPSNFGFTFVIGNDSYTGTPRSCAYDFNYTSRTGWHHYAITFNGTYGAAPKAYVDGVQLPTVSVSGASCSGTWVQGGSHNDFMQPARTATLTIGENPQHSGQGFNGSIADVSIYNTSLTYDEVVSIYNNESVAVGKLSVWYPFNESKMDAANSVNPCSYDGTGDFTITTLCTIRRNFTVLGTYSINSNTTFINSYPAGTNVIYNAPLVIFKKA